MDITVDFHSHGGGQGVHVKKVDSILNAVFDHHTLSVASDELGRRAGELVCQKKCRFLMAEVFDRKLADLAGVVGKGDFPVEDPGGAIRTGHSLQFNAPPGRDGLVSDLSEQFCGSPSQCHESNPHLVEAIEVGIGRELGIEDQLGRQLPRALFPELDEAQNLIVLIGLSNLSIGVAEDPAGGILGEEGQHTFLSSASLGDIVFFDESVLAMKGNGMEVEIEGLPPLHAQFANGLEPKLHEYRIGCRIDAAAVFREKGSLGDLVETCKESQSFIEDISHDMGVAGSSKELKGQQRSDCMRGRDHFGAGEAGLLQDTVNRDRGQIGEKKEKSSEFGPKSTRRKIQLAHIRYWSNLGTRRNGPLIISAPGKTSKSFFLQNFGDGGGAQLVATMGQSPTDIVDGEVLLSKSDDLLTHRISLWKSLRTFGRRKEKVAVRILAEFMAENPKAAGGVSEASSCLSRRETLDKESPQCLVLPVC